MLSDISFYFNNGSKSIYLPRNPAEINTDQSSTNKSTETARMGETTIVKGSKPLEIKFSVLLPSDDYFKSVPQAEKLTPQEYDNYFRTAMINGKVLHCTIAEIGIDMPVTVESMGDTFKAGEEKDIYLNMTIKEYRDYKLTEIPIDHSILTMVTAIKYIQPYTVAGTVANKVAKSNNVVVPTKLPAAIQKEIEDEDDLEDRLSREYAIAHPKEAAELQTRFSNLFKKEETTPVSRTIDNTDRTLRIGDIVHADGTMYQESYTPILKKTVVDYGSVQIQYGELLSIATAPFRYKYKVRPYKGYSGVRIGLTEEGKSVTPTIKIGLIKKMLDEAIYTYDTAKALALQEQLTVSGGWFASGNVKKAEKFNFVGKQNISKSTYIETGGSGGRIQTQTSE